MSVGKITDPTVTFKPSKKLVEFIESIQADDDIPSGIKHVKFNTKDCESKVVIEHKYLMADVDYLYLNNLGDDSNNKSKNNLGEACLELSKNQSMESKRDIGALNLNDLHWLYSKIEDHNRRSEDKIYFHELFDGSEIILPKNVEIPRNPELEKRCNLLKAQQANQQYKNMTKNVDNVRKNHPEDTISYQVKQLNRQLIAVFQFIVSVLAGFAFGFIGLEYIVGQLDFGFRLLLGIICALIIALAELYFLAKKLNEETNFEAKAEELSKKPKLN